MQLWSMEENLFLYLYEILDSKLHCVNDEILILPDNQKVIKGPRGGCYIYTGGKKKYIANKK